MSVYSKSEQSVDLMLRDAYAWDLSGFGGHIPPLFVQVTHPNDRDTIEIRVTHGTKWTFQGVNCPGQLLGEPLVVSHWEYRTKEARALLRARVREHAETVAGLFKLLGE